MQNCTPPSGDTSVPLLTALLLHHLACRILLYTSGPQEIVDLVARTMPPSTKTLSYVKGSYAPCPPLSYSAVHNQPSGDRPGARHHAALHYSAI